MTTTSKHKGQGLKGLMADKHAVTFAAGGTILSGASIWFNGHFGYEQGGLAMCAALIGFAVVKDAGISYAWAAIGKKGRVAAGVAGGLGFALSCLAALGASSHGREASANPLQAQIDAYETASKTEREAEATLAMLGNLSVAQAEGERAKITVDAGIFKRTAGCTAIEHKTSKRITGVNQEACKGWLAAQAKVDAAKEAAGTKAKLEAARAVIAKGRPASSDAQASTIAKILKLDGIDGVQAVLNIALALAIEITAPLCWAVFAGASAPKAPVSPTPAHQPVKTRAKPLTATPRGKAITVIQGGRMSDEEAEAIILADLAKGVSRKQEEYAEMFNKSVSTISRLIDRLTAKPEARIADEWVGTRRVLKMA